MFGTPGAPQHFAWGQRGRWIACRSIDSYAMRIVLITNSVSFVVLSDIFFGTLSEGNISTLSLKEHKRPRVACFKCFSFRLNFHSHIDAKISILNIIYLYLRWSSSVLASSTLDLSSQCFGSWYSIFAGFPRFCLRYSFESHAIGKNKANTNTHFRISVHFYHKTLRIRWISSLKNQNYRKVECFIALVSFNIHSSCCCIVWSAWWTFGCQIQVWPHGQRLRRNLTGKAKHEISVINK